MNCTVIDFEKNSMTFKIDGCTKEELENKMLLFFASENLSLKKEEGTEKIFQRGNKILRILLGVFVKYFKVKATINAQENAFTVTLKRDMNLALSGGLAGINSSHKEFERITDSFKANFNS